MTRLYNWHRDITFGASGAQQPTPGAPTASQFTYPTTTSAERWSRRGCTYAPPRRPTQTTVSAPARPTQRSRQAITRITYNAKGQKLSLELGNGTTTRYTYDPETFRLTHLFTRRTGVIAADCASNTPTLRVRRGPAACRTCTTPTTRSATSPTSRTTRSRHVFFANSAGRAEQRLHLRRALPADRGHRP